MIVLHLLHLILQMVALNSEQVNPDSPRLEIESDLKGTSILITCVRATRILLRSVQWLRTQILANNYLRTQVQHYFSKVSKLQMKQLLIKNHRILLRYLYKLRETSRMYPSIWSSKIAENWNEKSTNLKSKQRILNEHIAWRMRTNSDKSC